MLYAPAYCPHNCLWILRRHQEAIFAIFYEVGNTLPLSADGDAAGGHGLQIYDSKALPHTGHAEELRFCHLGHNNFVWHLTHETNRASDAKVFCQRLQKSSLSPLTDNRKAGSGIFHFKLRKSVERGIKVLLFYQMRHLHNGTWRPILR